MFIRLKNPISIGDLHRRFTLAQGQIISPETVVDSFTSSSKEVRAGTLFIACRGLGIDGHSFIDTAYDSGASAVVVADIEKLGGRPGFEAANARVLLSRLSALAFDYPSEQMRIIGVTGTNGKTTTNWIIYHALLALGQSCIRIGTLGYESSTGLTSPDTLTTPCAEELQSILAKAVETGCNNAVLEISSHALHQHRVDDISFDAAVFTNITHDHLDYHRTFEEYFRAKKRLFSLLRGSKKKLRVFSSNLDSEEGVELSKEYSASFEADFSFGSSDNSPVLIKEVVQHRTSSSVTLIVDRHAVQIETCFLGRHNAENLAAAFGLLYGLGYKAEQLRESFNKLPPVPGRLEPFESNGIATFVDYAHSPDALERILVCLKALPHARLILVFGCGGNKDWRKRAVMGNIAIKFADYIVVTSDNPRKEDPQKIIEDILESDLKEASNCLVLVDRAEAINRALSLAQSGDIVLVAGKGHENYQIVGEERRYFSDQDEIRKFFKS